MDRSIELLRDKFEDWRTQVRSDLNADIPNDANSLLPPVQVSDLTIYRRPGPITPEDILHAVPVHTRWFFTLFLDWLQTEYLNTSSTLVTLDGCLDLIGKMISYSFPQEIDVEHYKPKELWELPISTEHVRFAYFDDGLLITDRDVAAIAAFIETCPQCRLVSLAHNRIGFKQADHPKLITQIRRLLRIGSSKLRTEPTFVVNLIGNPCVRVGSKLFDALTDEEFAVLQFLSRGDFVSTHWQEAFAHRPETLKVITEFHSRLYSSLTIGLIC